MPSCASSTSRASGENQAGDQPRKARPLTAAPLVYGSGICRFRDVDMVFFFRCRRAGELGSPRHGHGGSARAKSETTCRSSQGPPRFSVAAGGGPLRHPPHLHVASTPAGSCQDLGGKLQGARPVCTVPVGQVSSQNSQNTEDFKPPSPGRQGCQIRGCPMPSRIFQATTCFRIQDRQHCLGRRPQT